MGTTRTKECEWIESEVRLFAPAGFEVECGKVFETKGYRIWLTKDSRSRPIDISLEEYQDRDWMQKVKMALGEFDSN